MQRVLSFPTQDFSDDGLNVVVRKRLCVASVFSVGLITLLTGFIMGKYASAHERLYKAQRTEVNTDMTEFAADTFILQSALASNIHAFIKALNSPHSANVSDNLKQAQQIQQHFKDQGMDSVSAILPSQVLLSYFKDDLNKIAVLDQEGEVVYRGTPLHFEVPQKTNKFEVINITTSSVVYVNFGRESDFHYLESKDITVKDRIVLARVGKVLPIDLVDISLKRGASGVVLIVDGDQSNDALYRSLLLPSQLGMLQTMHGNPALYNSHAVDNNNFGCVPVQIITGTVADKIFSHVFSDGTNPANWRTNLSVFYSVDSEYLTEDRQLRIEVHMVNTEEMFYSVIGAIRGSHEPDRYVLVANNRQPLLEEESESLGGAAAMMELVRVLAELKRSKGWRPRRSLVFCSWGLSQGNRHMTSSPLPEEWGHGLESRALGYISVETAVKGIGMFTAQTTPLLRNVLFESTALVPNPKREEVTKGRRTLYDAWLHATSGNKTTPPVKTIHGTGDLRTIIHNHGIPTLDFQFVSEENKWSETNGVTVNKDVNHAHHRAITQLWGVVVWKLSDSLIIPFDVVQYATFLNHSVAAISTKYHETIVKHTLPLNNLGDAVRNFSRAASAFQTKLMTVEHSNVLMVRILNDQLLQIERSFLHHKMMDKTNTAYRHIVLSPGKYLDNDLESGFGNLQDLLSDLTSCPTFTSLRASIVAHLRILVHCVMSATFLLQDSLQPLALVDL